MHITKRSISAISAALLSTFVVLSGAHAANRAYPGFQAKAYSSSDESCLSRWGGWVSNTCSWNITVLLPMSVDGAAWYNASVYGRRTGTATVTCRSTTIYFDGTIVTSPWRNFVYPDGRAESMLLGGNPIYVSGDALFAECVLGPSTVIFSYGWT
jgi:hypothetical protein